MSQPHPRSEHPPNTSFDPPSPCTHNNDNNHNHAHVPSTAFSGDMAQTYSQRTGGCNIVLADHLISLITPSLPPPTTTPSLRILDNACGPMVLTTQCLLDPSIATYPSVHISAVDLSADFIAANRTAISTRSTLGPKVDTAVMDGADLRFADDTFDVSFTSLGIFAFPDPVRGARELYRTLKPGGVTAATTWKGVGWLPLLHAVEEEVLQPGRAKTRLPFLEPWAVAGKLEATLREGGVRAGGRGGDGGGGVVGWGGGGGVLAYGVGEDDGGAGLE
ncbi:hypothetical protein HO173_005193 [Letharia columbiana]|uniref:Methyltransferase type 11 domain-containing protein n=1 Tax=Letharia columbiana TaxID=112416 RepID=A0A8H6L633_9LECA|nr:uncharacterized protein HO173_005193 [Letharia columbiana]KAF6236902.1 hypothetical protein HO173_005193 [Letharia columbiana]